MERVTWVRTFLSHNRTQKPDGFYLGVNDGPAARGAIPTERSRLISVEKAADALRYLIATKANKVYVRKFVGL